MSDRNHKCTKCGYRWHCHGCDDAEVYTLCADCKAAKPEGLTVYFLAWFKFDDKGPEYGFKRCHLQTFYTTIENARAALRNFDDEAGWYHGVLIEEKKEGNPHYRGHREWYLQQPDGTLVDMPEPKAWNCIINFIG